MRSVKFGLLVVQITRRIKIGATTGHYDFTASKLHHNECTRRNHVNIIYEYHREVTGITCPSILLLWAL